MAEKKEKQVTFEESLNTSETFFLKNRKMIFGILGAVIVLVVGGILYHSYVSLPREDEASTELAKSEQLMMQQQYDQALKGFQRVAADYGSTDAGNLANLYTALCYAHLQKPDWKKALEYAEKFSTRDDKIISPESQVALADIYVNNDQTDKAIETLKKAAEMADSRADGSVNLSVAPLALLKAGQLLESKNKKAEALEVYKSIKQKYVASPLYQEIDKYIERVSR